MNSNLMFLHLNQTQAQSLSEPISYAKQCEWLIDSYAFDLLTISTANFFFLLSISSQACPLTGWR